MYVHVHTRARAGVDGTFAWLGARLFVGCTDPPLRSFACGICILASTHRTPLPCCALQLKPPSAGASTAAGVAAFGTEADTDTGAASSADVAQPEEGAGGVKGKRKGRKPKAPPKPKPKRATLPKVWEVYIV